MNEHCSADGGELGATELHVSEFQLIAITAIIFCYTRSWQYRLPTSAQTQWKTRN